jgi:hypothetical protein
VAIRPDKASPLTAEEHADLGHEIKLVGTRLRELERLVTSVYGPGNQAAFSFVKAVESIERLQDDLEAQAALDVPGHPGRFYS